MSTLVIALGNTLRADDGVAQEVLKHLTCDSRAYLELTPEVSSVIAPYETVVFVDADCQATEVTVEPVPETISPSALTHACDPGTVVALAQALFGFTGQALLCRIPASDFSFREGLSDTAKEHAALAASRLHF